MHTTTTTTRRGGDSRGNSYARRARKLWMLATWGDGESCPCVHCDARLTFETVEADRIVPGSQGGSYARENVQPACRHCNASRQDRIDWQPAMRRVFA